MSHVGLHSRRPRIAFCCVVILLGAASKSIAEDEFAAPEFDDSRRFRRVAFAVHAGFSGWNLSSLETTLDHRANVLAVEGFQLGGAEFPASSAFGVELEVRFSEAWFARAGADWSRTRTDVRDRRTLPTLGGRRPVSVMFETRVDPNPFLFTAGAGRKIDLDDFRLGVSASAVIAPLQIEETYEIVLDTASKSTVRASGIGLGLEAAVSADYFTDARMNLFAEVFARFGSATATLDDPVRESELVPGERDVDFTGVGIRFGFRWI